MLIGIDGSRAFIKNRTGIEEYSYQVIKNLRSNLDAHRIILYLRKNQEIDFELPENWSVKKINCFRLWTQIGLSLEMFLHPVDVLFIPAHTVPIIHPKKTVVVIHGLEYEFCSEAYSWFERFYMRLTIKKSCQWASSIIAVSNNTKLDLERLYNVNSKKIQVIYEGCNNNFQFPISNFQKISNDKISKKSCHSDSPAGREESRKIIDSETKLGILLFTRDDGAPFLLFIGRIEERKNISNIIKAFEILKEKYNIPHKLVLAGKPGFGYDKIQNKIQDTRYNNQIVLTGFISEEEKWELLKNADVFVFPTLYEGFGIPVLEAQSVGCPVVASNNSSIPEVTTCHSERVSQQDDESRNLSPDLSTSFRPIGLNSAQDDILSALLVDPQNPENIAENIYKIISNKSLKDDIIAKGLANVKRFSWEKCAKEILTVLLK